MTGKKTVAVIASAAVIVGIGGEAFGQTRARRSIKGPLTSESIVRSLSIVPAPEETGATGRVDPRPPAEPARLGAGAAPGRPSELSVMLRINFALESAELTPEARRDLDQVASALLDPRLAGVPVTLEGHTDATGDALYNLNLSERRAAAVLAYLVTRGVDRGRLQAVGHGEHRPSARKLAIRRLAAPSRARTDVLVECRQRPMACARRRSEAESACCGGVELPIA